MIKAAIDKILDLQRPPYFEVDGRKYFANNDRILEPKPIPIKLTTLTGLVDFFNLEIHPEDDQEIFIQVDDPCTASILGPVFGPFRQRTIFAVSKFEQESSSKFGFGVWYSPEQFIISLQSQFCPSNDLGTVLSVVGNIRDENVKTTSDDGVTQSVTARSGIARIQEVEVPNPVTLFPYRTFLEIDQPPLLCVLRMKSGAKDSGAPSCALFEADGGMWKIEAMKRIKEWLVEQLPDVVVVA